MPVTFHRTSSDRQQVIAVHSSASTGGQWLGLVEDLSPSFDVFTPDLPGYGRMQGVSYFGPPTLDGDAIGIAGIVQRASTPVHLVAHSYGAAVALKFALEGPERIASLTLIEPALFHLLRNGGPEDLALYSEIGTISDTVRLSRQNGTPELGMSRFVDYWNGPETWQAMKPLMQSVLSAQSRQVSRNFAASFAATWSASMFQRIQCPTMIISAQNSREPAKRVAEIVSRSISHARLISIPDAGHMVPVTHPGLINSLIAGVIDSTVCSGIAATQRAAA